MKFRRSKQELDLKLDTACHQASRNSSVFHSNAIP